MRRLFLLAPLALIACAPKPEPVEPEVVLAACDAANYSQFMGEPQSVFASATFPAPMRIIQVGQPVTQDFNPDRINFVIGNDGTVVQIWCG